MVPEVVARVREAAARLGYTPNPFARSLRVRESKTLGLIVPDNTVPFFAEVARGVEAACFRAGYTLILCNSDRSVEKEMAQARVLQEKRVDGLLLFNTSQESAATIEWLRQQQLPFVLVERRPPGPGASVDCVIGDNAAGTRAAIEHLAGLGHQSIACLLGDPLVSHHAERLKAYHAAVRDLGLTAAPELVRTDLITYADGQRTAIELLTMARPPTALFCANDTLAISALRGATLAGRRVPDDVAIVGFGNTEVTAYTQPPLTTVAQEKLAVGAMVVRVLLRRLAQRARGQQWRPRAHVVPTRLVVRESTQRAALEAPAEVEAPTPRAGLSRLRLSPARRTSATPASHEPRGRWRRAAAAPRRCPPDPQRQGCSAT